MRSLDDDGGKLIAATYARMLGNYPREALAYMVERAIAELKWFPTVAECREMLADWRRDDGPLHALRLANSRMAQRDRERVATAQEQHEDAMLRLQRGQMTQAEVDALPQMTAWAAEARGWLRHDQGRFVLRKAAA